MRGAFGVLRVAVWLTQLGLSVAGPPVLFLLLGSWLHKSCGWGGWVVVVCIILGVLGAAGGLISSLRTLNRLGHSPEDEPPMGFNDHD